MTAPDREGASVSGEASGARAVHAPSVPSAPPVYDTIGQGYVAHRRPDPRWAALIAQQVGDASLVVNVGAGTGSYEPERCAVIAIEPSSVMISQRPAGTAPAVRASASALPLPSRCADVALAILTVHHWDDATAGLVELCRVAACRVIVAIDFDLHARFWLLDEYLPEVAAFTRRLGPGADEIATLLGDATVTIPLLVPRDMCDGVLGAYWCRPEAYLDPTVRANCSGLALADPGTIVRGVAALESDLASGAWHRRHADLSDRESVDIGYRLLISTEA